MAHSKVKETTCEECGAALNLQPYLQKYVNAAQLNITFKCDKYDNMYVQDKDKSILPRKTEHKDGNNISGLASYLNQN